MRENSNELCILKLKERTKAAKKVDLAYKVVMQRTTKRRSIICANAYHFYICYLEQHLRAPHCNFESNRTMKAFFPGLVILALFFGQSLAAPMDEMEMDENQGNSLESDEYSRQLYKKVSFFKFTKSMN